MLSPNFTFIKRSLWKPSFKNSCLKIISEQVGLTPAVKGASLKSAASLSTSPAAQRSSQATALAARTPGPDARPRGARGASCDHGRNLSTLNVPPPSPVTGTERCLHYYSRTPYNSRFPSGLSLAPPRGGARGCACAICAPRYCLGNDPWGVLAGLWTRRAAYRRHSPPSARLPVQNRMRAGWAPCL